MFNHSLSQSSFAGRTGRPVAALVAGLAQRTLDRLSQWRDLARSRRLLATLDDRMLSDIGVDRATAHREASTAFWR
jgi:uncharacterized protein YjiS (DUF1127 family)